MEWFGAVRKYDETGGLADKHHSAWRLRENDRGLAGEKLPAGRGAGRFPIGGIIAVSCGVPALERCAAAVRREGPGRFVVVAHFIDSDEREAVGVRQIRTLQFETLAAIL